MLLAERVIKKTILNKMETARTVSFTIRRRQPKYTADIMRKKVLKT